MTSSELLDLLIKHGLGIEQALAEAKRMMSEARAWNPGESHTFYLRSTGQPVVLITKH